MILQTKLKSFPLKIVAIMMAILSTPIMASDLKSQPTNTTVKLENVSVTATRTKEEIAKQARSISKKTGQELQLDQVVFQKDALNSIAGVNITSTGSVIGHTTAIRTPNTT